MLLLVTDTSGKHGSIAVVRAGVASDPYDVDVIESVPLAGGTFSAQLVPQIATLLARHGFSRNEIDAFVVVSGPGSFTGLRVGLAAIKGLAEILRKPIVPVSLLEVVAWSEIFVAAGAVPDKQTVFRYATALDAGRGEAFVGQFEVVVEGKKSRTPTSTRESLLSFESVADLVESSGAQWIVTPDATVADFLTERGTAKVKHAVLKQAERPGSKAVARVGWHKLQAGETVTSEQLEANYIRRTDAEIFAKPASSS